MASTAMEPDSAELSKLKADIAPQMDALVEKIEALAARDWHTGRHTFGQ